MAPFRRARVSRHARVTSARRLKPILDCHALDAYGLPAVHFSVKRSPTDGSPLVLAPNTVKKYVSILEGLYIIFLVRPYHRRLAGLEA